MNGLFPTLQQEIKDVVILLIENLVDLIANLSKHKGAELTDTLKME